MTASEPHPDAIAALERRVTLGIHAGKVATQLEGDIEALQIRLIGCRAQIQEGEHAQRILDHLTDQTDKALASGDLMSAYNESPTASELIRPERAPDLAQLPITATPIAETKPTGTTETVESGLGNSTTNSTQLPINPEQPNETTPPHALTNRERLEQWIATLDASAVITVQQAAKATSMPHASAATYLPKLIGAGLLERLFGTGTPGVPSQYRKPQAVQPSDVQAQHEAAPLPADPADDQERVDLTPDPTPAVTIANERPSGKARLLGVLNDHPDQRWTSAQLEIEADLSHGAVYKHMRDFVADGRAHVVPDSSPVEYRAGPQAGASSPAGLLPIPTRLSTDERELYDALRRESEGLTGRLLTHRLNWTIARTEKAVQSLVKSGHIGRNGDKLRVIPPELQGEQDGAA